MEFFTSIHLYRPQSPPVIITSAIADFIDRVLATSIVAHPSIDLSLKYGDFVDHDVNQMILGRCDVTEYNLDLTTAQNILRKEDKALYRALISLGSLTDQITDALSHDPGPENEIGLYPDTLGMQIGPIILGKPNEETRYRSLPAIM